MYVKARTAVPAQAFLAESVWKQNRIFEEVDRYGEMLFTPVAGTSAAVLSRLSLS